MEINNDEIYKYTGKSGKTGGAKVTSDLMEVREQVMGLSGERAFQAEKWASTKTLECLHV